jgi:hypothetical protein
MNEREPFFKSGTFTFKKVAMAIVVTVIGILALNFLFILVLQMFFPGNGAD